jgi:predicted O-methyltransferase YrrM
MELLKKEVVHFPCGRKSLLYIAVRLLRPAQVVETGVWFGFSKAQILQALEDNGGAGRLYSIDAPNVTYDAGSYVDAKLLPSGMQPGFVIPRHLLGRWDLVVGYSKDVLPPLLERIGPIDVFFHDSMYTYENQIFEYRTAWSHLKPGGVLISDDVHLNSAFVDFCQEVGTRAYVFQGYGIAVKALARGT